MALKAGYYGVKKSVIDLITSLVGNVAIKSIGGGLALSEEDELSVDTGDGLTVSEAGKLLADIDTETMEFKTGKLAAKIPQVSGGNFIDEANIIATDSAVSSLSYTATNDCYISLYLVPTTDARVKINNVDVANMSAPQNMAYGAPVIIPLKKNDVVNVTGLNATYASNYKVFGLK